MECKVRDITMTYDEVGTGRPLLVLDGWGYSGRFSMVANEPVYGDRGGTREAQLHPHRKERVE